MAVKEERGNRIFPVSDKSIDVLNAFTKELNKKQVKIKFDAKVTGIEVEKNKVKAVTYIDKNNESKKLLVDKVILATGGKHILQRVQQEMDTRLQKIRSHNNKNKTITSTSNSVRRIT